MALLQLKLHTNVIPVVLADDEGKETHYELREMRAAERDRYLDKLAQRMELDKEGKARTIRKFEGMHAELLCLCLYKDVGEEQFRLIAKEEVQSWPASVVSEIFQAAQGINNLAAKEGSENATEAQPEKND